VDGCLLFVLLLPPGLKNSTGNTFQHLLSQDMSHHSSSLANESNITLSERLNLILGCNVFCGSKGYILLSICYNKLHTIRWCFVANKRAEVALFHITDEQITMIAKMNKLFD
jgi:hypothetical protein